MYTGLSMRNCMEDRKVLEVIFRMTPEKLYTDYPDQCKNQTHQEVVEEYYTSTARELVRDLSLRHYYAWVCTRPKGHSGLHVASWPTTLCPIEPWKDV